jgi:hypothetical protein
MSDSLEKLKPSRLKRELIPFILISIITISTLMFFTYQDSIGSIQYSPEIPTIRTKISDEISNTSQQCFMKFEPISFEFKQNTWANRFLTANIRRRNSDGGLSFELNQNENLFNIRNDDDWLLLPPGKNLDAFRAKMAFDIYNMLSEDDSNYRLPKSILTELYINEEYQGIYLLAERIDRKMLGLNEENIGNIEENDVIIKTMGWDGDFYEIPTFPESNVDQLFPNSINYSHKFVDLVDFVLNSDEEEFFDENIGIFSLLDKNSVIDNFLFGLFSESRDTPII